MTAEGELVGLFLKEPVPPGMSVFDTVRAILLGLSRVTVGRHQIDRRRAAH